MALINRVNLPPLSRRFGGTSAVIAIAATILLSFWLRAAYPPVGVWAPHDDTQFVRLAEQIGAGKWLGPYDQLTLATGVFFPLFLAVNKATGLPLKITEHFVYLSASLLAAITLVRLTGRREILLPAFIGLALSPIPWTMDNARVIRDPLYESLCLVLFCLALLFLTLRRPLTLGLCLGLVAACYWLTREEGVWLAPALAVLALPWLANVYRTRPKEAALRPSSVWLKDVLRIWWAPFAACVLVVFLVNSANFVAYGVFRNNDFRSGAFPAAYGALTRIKHDEWKRFVVFPRDARERAYAVSPAARELRPHLEGKLGRGWITVSQHYPKPWGCPNDPANCNNEILSGWFPWALRHATSAAGHYRSARAAAAFYTRLADEINTACDKEIIPCHGPRASLTPIWRNHYLVDALTASIGIGETLITLDHGSIGVERPALTAEQARMFENATNSRLSGLSDVDKSTPSGLQETRVGLTRSIATIYSRALPPLFVLALLSYVFLLVVWVGAKSAGVRSNEIVVLTALLVAILCRVGLLGFLEATSMPFATQYLLPAFPFYLLFVTTSICLGVAAIRGNAYSKAALT